MNEEVLRHGTGKSAVVGDEAGHVDVLVVDAQVLHAAHVLLAAHGEILRELRDPPEEQGAGQVQRSVDTGEFLLSASTP